MAKKKTNKTLLAAAALLGGWLLFSSFKKDNKKKGGNGDEDVYEYMPVTDAVLDAWGDDAATSGRAGILGNSVYLKPAFYTTTDKYTEYHLLVKYQLPKVMIDNGGGLTVEICTCGVPGLRKSGNTVLYDLDTAARIQTNSTTPNILNSIIRTLRYDVIDDNTLSVYFTLSRAEWLTVSAQCYTDNKAFTAAAKAGVLDTEHVKVLSMEMCKAVNIVKKNANLKARELEFYGQEIEDFSGSDSYELSIEDPSSINDGSAMAAVRMSIDKNSFYAQSIEKPSTYGSNETTGANLGYYALHYNYKVTPYGLNRQFHVLQDDIVKSVADELKVPNEIGPFLSENAYRAYLAAKELYNSRVKYELLDKNTYNPYYLYYEQRGGDERAGFLDHNWPITLYRFAYMLNVQVPENFPALTITDVKLMNLSYFGTRLMSFDDFLVFDAMNLPYGTYGYDSPFAKCDSDFYLYKHPKKVRMKNRDKFGSINKSTSDAYFVNPCISKDNRALVNGSVRGSNDIKAIYEYSTETPESFLKYILGTDIDDDSLGADMMMPIIRESRNGTQYFNGAMFDYLKGRKLKPGSNQIPVVLGFPCSGLYTWRRAPSDTSFIPAGIPISYDGILTGFAPCYSNFNNIKNEVDEKSGVSFSASLLFKFKEVKTDTIFSMSAGGGANQEREDDFKFNHVPLNTSNEKTRFLSDPIDENNGFGIEEFLTRASSKTGYSYE